MKREVGLWIDHTKAIVVTLIGDTYEIRQVRSNIGKYVHFLGGSVARPLYGTCNISGNGKQDLEFKSFLNEYFKGVVSLLHQADSIWIIGPGNAKGELEKHIQRDRPDAHIVGIENVEMMTDRQVATRVRLYYQVDR
jgi:hypothetical protein